MAGKRNHYIPKAILINHADVHTDCGKIQLVDMELKRGGSIKCRDCFKFNHFYSDDLEDKFRELEKNAIDVLRRLMTDDLDDKTMDEKSINVLRKYILLQMMRTPVGRTCLLDRINMEQMDENVIPTASCEIGDRTTDEFWYDLMEKALDLDWDQLTSCESPYIRVAALSLNMSLPVVFESALDLPVPDTGLFVESSPFRIHDDIDKGLVEDVFNMRLSDGQYEKLISEPGRYNNCIGIPWDRRHAVALVDFAWLKCEKDPGVELRRHLKSFLLRDKALDINASYINTERGPFNYMVVPRIVLNFPQSCHLAILLMMNASRMIAFGSFEGIREPLMYCIENIQGGENLSFISECDFSIRFPYDTEKLNPSVLKPSRSHN